MNAKKKISIIMIDQRIAISNALIDTFKTHTRNWDFLSFKSVPEAIEKTDNIDKDTLFLLNIGGIESSETTLENHIVNIRHIFSNVPIIILADNEKLLKLSLFSYLKLNGFITTNTSTELLTACIQVVILGGVYIPKKLILTSSYIETQIASIEDEKIIDEFTPRQKEVAILLYNGLSNKVIACELDISESTVKAHITNIMKKLGVTNRTQAVRRLIF